MKHYLVTMTLEVPGDTPAEVAVLADSIVDWMWDRLGDAGQVQGRPCVTSIGTEPLPETEEEET